VNNMRGFIGLTKRNMLIFFKDKQAVFFSLLTSIIVMGLYLLFLKKNLVDSINSGIAENELWKNMIKDSDIDMLVSLIFLTGIVGSALITVPYNCLQTIIRDREKKVDYDILATPIKRWQIILSYFTAATCSAIILTCIILSIGLLVIKGNGNIYMDLKDVLGAYTIVAFGSVSATSLFMIVILFFKTSASSEGFFGMLSAASGFVIGAYIPISQFSTKVQTVCNLFPGTQITTMLRNKLLNGMLENIDKSIVDKNQEAVSFSKPIKELFSFEANVFDTSFSMREMFLYVSVILVLSIIIQIIVFSKNYKRK